MQFKPKTIEGVTGAVVRFEYTSPTPHELFSIYAYNTGIELVGQTPRIKTQEDLEGLAKGIATAWQKHQELKRLAAK